MYRFKGVRTRSISRKKYTMHGARIAYESLTNRLHACESLKCVHAHTRTCIPGIMPLRPQKYIWAPFSRREKSSSACSATCVWHMCVCVCVCVCVCAYVRGRTHAHRCASLIVANLVLNVHLSPLWVCLLSRQSIVYPEVVWVLSLDLLPVLCV